MTGNNHMPVYYFMQNIDAYKTNRFLHLGKKEKKGLNSVSLYIWKRFSDLADRHWPASTCIDRRVTPKDN